MRKMIGMVGVALGRTWFPTIPKNPKNPSSDGVLRGKTAHFQLIFAHIRHISVISMKNGPDFFGYKIYPLNFAVPKSKGSECLLYNNW
jgi:hypothetical protein